MLFRIGVDEKEKRRGKKERKGERERRRRVRKFRRCRGDGKTLKERPTTLTQT